MAYVARMTSPGPASRISQLDSAIMCMPLGSGPDRDGRMKTQSVIPPLRPGRVFILGTMGISLNAGDSHDYHTPKHHPS